MTQPGRRTKPVGQRCSQGARTLRLHAISPPSHHYASRRHHSQIATTATRTTMTPSQTLGPIIEVAGAGGSIKRAASIAMLSSATSTGALRPGTMTRNSSRSIGPTPYATAPSCRNSPVRPRAQNRNSAPIRSRRSVPRASRVGTCIHQGLRTTFLRDFRDLSQHTQQVLVFPPCQ